MNQNFVVPNISNPESLRATKRISAITHTMQRKVIKIEQLDPAFKKVQGIIDMKVLENRDYQRNKQPRYRGQIVYSSGLEFGEDPYPTDAPQGTGLVMYLLDDDEPVPVDAKSGAARGWNREFLASNLKSGWFRICDNTVEKDIKKRMLKIQERIEEEEPQMQLIRERMERQGDAIKGRNKQEHVVKHIIQGGPKEGLNVVPQPQEDKITPVIEALQKKIAALEAEVKEAKKAPAKEPELVNTNPDEKESFAT